MLGFLIMAMIHQGSCKSERWEGDTRGICRWNITGLVNFYQLRHSQLHHTAVNSITLRHVTELTNSALSCNYILQYGGSSFSEKGDSAFILKGGYPETDNQCQVSKYKEGGGPKTKNIWKYTKTKWMWMWEVCSPWTLSHPLIQCSSPSPSHHSPL